MSTFTMLRLRPWLAIPCLVFWTACSSAPTVEFPVGAEAPETSTESTWKLTEPSPPLLDGDLPFEDAALDPSKTLTHIGFGSCLDQAKEQPIFDAVLAEDFDLFFFLGDNVYGDVTSPAMTELREAYRQQAQRSQGLRTLRAQTPVRATWDDHDYGDNDIGAHFFGKEASQGFFAEFWNLPPDSPARQRPGIYDAMIVGPPGQRVQVMVLDTRYFRSDLQRTPEPDAVGRERYVPDDDPGKTLLGDAQWSWLEEQLRKPAEVRILVSSIQVLAEGHGWEAWRQLPTERRRLYDLIESTGAEGIVILSGDRHRAGIYRHMEAIGYPLYEITSSALNAPSSHPEEPGPMRLGPTYRPVNYGAVTLDWKNHIVRLEIRDLQGNTTLRQDVELANLRR